MRFDPRREILFTLARRPRRLTRIRGKEDTHSETSTLPLHYTCLFVWTRWDNMWRRFASQLLISWYNLKQHSQIISPNLLWFKLQGGAHLCFKQRYSSHQTFRTVDPQWTLNFRAKRVFFLISFYTASGFLMLKNPGLFAQQQDVKTVI